MSLVVTEAAATADAIPAIGADGRLFPVGKLAAHQSGQLHLAISVFLFHGDAMLLQRRALGKYHCGGQWANSCCSHPHWGESLSDAAHRRTREELGVSVRLIPAATITYRAAVGQHLVEHERVTLFAAAVDRYDFTPAPDPDEVMEVCWASRAEISQEVQRRPEDFAPWFRIYLNRWRALGLHKSPAALCAMAH